jgi:hypothetical protein
MQMTITRNKQDDGAIHMWIPYLLYAAFCFMNIILGISLSVIDETNARYAFIVIVALAIALLIVKSFQLYDRHSSDVKSKTLSFLSEKLTILIVITWCIIPTFVQIKPG